VQTVYDVFYHLFNSDSKPYFREMFGRRDVEAELRLDSPDVRRYLLLDGVEQCLGLEG
jgi:hypothetical protein